MSSGSKKNIQIIYSTKYQGRTLYPCRESHCDRAFFKVPDLKLHLSKKHGIELNMCDENHNNKITDEISGPQSNKKSTNPITIDLTEDEPCIDLTVEDEDIPREHRLVTRSRINENHYCCQVCDKKFVSPEGMLQHYDRHRI